MNIALHPCDATERRAAVSRRSTTLNCASGEHPFPPQLLHKLVRYESGKLFWLARDSSDFPTPGVTAWNRTYAGKPLCVSPSPGGRGVVKILQRRIQAHRVIWALHAGKWPTHTIDHINGNCADNRVENLRDIPIGDNVRAYHRMKRGNEPSGPHQVKIRIPNGRRIYVGSFPTEAEAAAATRGAYAVIDELLSVSREPTFSALE